MVYPGVRLFHTVHRPSTGGGEKNALQSGKSGQVQAGGEFAGQAGVEDGLPAELDARLGYEASNRKLGGRVLKHAH